MIPSSCKRTKHSFTALDSFWRSVGGNKIIEAWREGLGREIESEKGEREGRGKEGEGGGRRGEFLQGPS